MSDYDLFGNIDASEPSLGIQQGKTVLQTHPASVCESDPSCCLHNPSEHALKDAPLNWRADRRLMERICEHGVGHPDPDDLAFKRRTLAPEVYKSYAFAVHGCDGCCFSKQETKETA